MFIRILQALLLTTGTICSGCQQQNTAVSPATNNTRAPIKNSNISNSVDAVNITSDDSKQKPTVIAYYFHRTVRCPTCIAIEANAAKVIETDFQEQSADGRLMWISFNLDDQGGEEFEKEFDVSVSTLVLSKTKDGNHTEYKKLEKVWDFIGDPVKFDSYVQNEVKQFLNE
jgi:hypothetical protein